MRFMNPIRLAVVAVLAFAPASFAQRNTGNQPPPISRIQPRSLRITVLEEGTELPIASAQVSVRGRLGSSTSDTTNGAGDCFFPNIPGDNYQIFVNMTGYDSGSATVELLDDTALTLRLRKKADPNAPGGSSVSVRTLKLPQKAREAYEHGMQELYTKHNPAKSLPYFHTTLVEAPDFYEAHHQTGVAMEQMGRAQDAENEYKEAIRMSDGQFGPSQFSMAAMLSGRKDFAAAEAACRKGLESTPQSGLGHYELARALLGEGKLDAAEQEANESLGEVRKIPKAYLVLAAVHDQRHEPGKVYHDLTEYLKLVPTGPTSDRMRQRLDEIRQEMEKKNAGTGNPAGTPPR